MIRDENQELFGETLRAFARDRLKPNYGRWENEALPADFVTALGQLGVLGLLVPEEYGGSGGDFVSVGIASEELARGDFNVSSFVQLAGIAAVTLRSGASSSVASEWLPQIADGSAIPAIALTEPDAGSDAGAITTRARETADGWSISGEKSSITFAGSADGAIVFARTGGKGPFGVSAFWVPLDLPGVQRHLHDGAGGKATLRGSIVFDEVEVSSEHMLGNPGSGIPQAMTAFNFNRAVIALGCIGAALESIEETVEYTSTRETFGQALSSRQAVTQQVAEHYSKLHAARLIAYQTLNLADAQQPHDSEAAMAKWMGPLWSTEAIHACLRLHGWAGYGTDLPFEQRLRDVIGLEIGDGTAELMKAIVSRGLYGTATHR